MFSFPVNPEIRLTLLEHRHAQDLFELTHRNRSYLREWLPWVDATESPEDSKNFIDLSLNQHAKNRGFNCGIFYKNQFAGCIGFHSFDWQNKRTSLGYWLGEEFQGLGIMTNACRAMIAHAFTELGLNRIEIRAGVHNAKSRAIPEKLGFQQEGTIRQAEWLYDHFIDHAVYGLLSSDWKTKKG